MNNWQLSFLSPVDLTDHLRKPYLNFDNRDKSVSKLIFDEYANLIWVGDSYGKVSSYDATYAVYTRYTSHIGSGPVKDLLSHIDGVLSLSEDSLHFSSRRGVTRLNLTSANIGQFSGLTAACFASPQQNLVFCGGSNTASGLLTVDLHKGGLCSELDYTSKIKLLESDNKVVAIGKQTGSVDILDINSNRVVRTFPGHSSTITGMDLRDYNLVTVGKSKRFNTLSSDPFVNVYDLRMMSQLAPVAFSQPSAFRGTEMGGADFVHLHPVLPTVMTVASTSGGFDFVDLANPSVRSQYCHPCQNISEFVLSPNGDYLAFLEDEKIINLWSRTNGMTGFSNSSTTLEFPDFPDEAQTDSPRTVDDMTFPLSSVGMPYYNEKLLSAWSHSIFRSDGTLPRKVEYSLSGGKQYRPRSIAPTTVTSKFSLLPYNRSKYGPRNISRPYRSLRERRKKLLVSDEDGTDKAELMRYKSNNEFEVPPAYSKLQMIYGKYGVEDFDFKAFNTTAFSGLESDIDNCYTNAVLQLYKFVPELYNFTIDSLRGEDFDQTSLLAQIGYLYDMMQTANGIICRSSNFQEAMASIPEAVEHNLITDSIADFTLSTKLADMKINGGSVQSERGELLQQSTPSVPQRFNDFLLGRLVSEEVERKINTTQSIALEELFGIQIETETRSLSTCGSRERNFEIVSTLAINSPARNNGKYSQKKLTNQTVLPFIESSMNRFSQVQVMCERCHSYETVECEKAVRNLPPLLSLNLSLTQEEWSIAKLVKNWLVPEFYATISKNRPILKVHATDLKTSKAIFRYDLNGYVARICDDFSEPHLVTYVKVYDTNAKVFKWYMFNDFLVTEIEEQEALNINHWWKTPEILIYSDVEELQKPFITVLKSKLDKSILYRDFFSNARREQVKREYKLLSQAEVPKCGSLVAIDAEFVMLSSEKLEINYKGQKTLVKPKKTALARVSVLRGDDGENFGVPFIDDYIENKNHIENYLTRFSGIEPGDLDPATSCKSLVPRQVAYRKIWLLLQLGCVFVGHGLQNDFRNINIHVPLNQIRDTALYFLQGKRYLALRYLAYALLDIDVQSGNHDSIEDAYTALMLYRKYRELQERGHFEQVLTKLYEDGRACGFRAPDLKAV
ncbi:LAMI_0D09868g1_1 [Lachancea mirantina]|uniref:PAN2-PAN3 deadenylation complex catalytic subunit PAN2 n=1 Tax=Lachancea mirantina TaxID=1230905 RepID=A0A1G4JDR5_9SACH|nr:LAMI_0D09868g1_1 [Lachancea mirantina]